MVNVINIAHVCLAVIAFALLRFVLTLNVFGCVVALRCTLAGKATEYRGAFICPVAILILFLPVAEIPQPCFAIGFIVAFNVGDDAISVCVIVLSIVFRPCRTMF